MNKVTEVIRDYGYQDGPVEVDHYFLGAGQLPIRELRPDGQWDDFLPVYESQERGRFDSMNCTNYGTLNCWETLYRLLFGEEINWSERYTGVMTGTARNGNDVHKVAEIIRKECGLILESKLPFSPDIDSWSKYYFPTPMTREFLEMGKGFLQTFALGHEWVFTDGSIKSKQRLLMEALKFSPAGVSVRAWKRNPKTGLYSKRKGESDTHWVMLYGYVEREYWKVYDHYDQTFKHLEWDYDFGRAKRYFIEKITPAQQQKVGILTQLRDVLVQLIIRIAPAGLGEKIRYGLERD
jgi:hypothetical protein